MQDIFGDDLELRKLFIKSLSHERLSRYRTIAHGDEIRAIRLYKWNSDLSQSLGHSMQAWEICLRNKLNAFLCWRYNSNWPYDETRAVRQMKGNDARRVREARERQERDRRMTQAPLGAIVADLAAGFWVSLLGTSYDVPFSWTANLKRVFPHDRALDRRDAWTICDELLDLRNRIAHHEPILHLPLEQRHRDLARIIAAMCPGTHAYCQGCCSFWDVWRRRP